MNDLKQRQEQLSMLLKLGVAQLGAGHLTSATVADVERAATACGLGQLTVLSTASTLAIEHAPPTQPVLGRVARVTQIDVINCEQLRKLAQVSRSIRSGRVDVGEADRQIDAATALSTPWWWSTIGATAVAFFVTLQVGVSPFVAMLAAILHALVTVLGAGVARLDFPRLFKFAVQAFFGGAIALVFVSAGVLTGNAAAACVAVSWAMLVPLPLVLGIAVDATSGEYQSALVRAVGIVVAVGGIAIGAMVATVLARSLPDIATTSVDLPIVPPLLAVLFCTLGAMANAFANSGGARLLVPAAIAGAVTGLCNQTLQHVVGVPSLWAGALSAALLGFLAVPCAKRAGYPAAVLALMGITGALLPGLTVYQGIVNAMDGNASRGYFEHTALVVTGLGIGSALGFLLASYTGRHGRWARQPGD
ncbi:threonine/serine exporter family protein [Diaphorobacter aerolatus]|uniref:Threonine/serine exporter family protein n=1 Tax=Diaphorobacter aerolatus TaxID=1288495 RepID=A0A7H0GI10_9BURK|nr:threonine/serine exporter family protein [Diaphorobacter aerolatus]QNP47926.1 threonine/serine exporter family protein [Diaphorobacter aerolatus]